MRPYKTSFDQQEVDLNDPTLYDHLPNDTSLLDDLMFKEIGYALCYMNYFHPIIFPKSKKHKINDLKLCGYQQRKRIKKLIKYFCANRHDHYNDVLWLKEQVYLFQDETENMC